MRGSEGGSWSGVCGISGEFGGGVFHGMTISRTGWPSTDSTAEMVTSVLLTGTVSPVSVMTERALRGVISDPLIWKRFRR